MGEIWQSHISKHPRYRVGTAYDEVGDDDLHDLGLQAWPAGEHLLEDRDHEVAQWGADEGAVDGHLWHAAGKVMTVLVAVFGDPGGKEFL